MTRIVSIKDIPKIMNFNDLRSPFLVQHILELSAAKLPDKVALICGKERLKYSEINEQSNQLGVALRQMGIQRQDRVAIFMDNSAEAVISIFGILKADAIFLILSPTLKPSKLSYILNDCQVKVLITDSSKTDVVSEALPQSESVRHVLWSGLSSQVPTSSSSCVSHHSFKDILRSALCSMRSSSSLAPSALGLTPYTLHPAPCKNVDLDLATIIYTSGSTGKPKGVMLSHLNMLSAAHSIISYLGNREDDVIIDVLPLSFDYGLYQILMAFRFGGTVVLERTFTYPYEMVQKIVEEKVTGFPVVPTIIALLLRLDDLGKFNFSNLRYITNTGEAFPPTQINCLRKLLPHVRIYSMYGLTECKRVSYLPPEEIDRRPESVGKGMPNEEVWIADESGRPVGPGKVGELVVRGANVMRGYWGLPQETSQVLKEGNYPGEKILYTGDLFRLDENGFLYFVSRKDDMFKSRGKMVSPREIEQCLCSLTGVSAAAVIGVADEIMGNAIVALICPDGQGITEEEVIKHCQANLEDHLIPQVIRITASIPRTNNGKIDKLALRAEYSKELREDHWS